jgi:hypothetical protein
MISLSFTIRLISSTTRELTNTASRTHVSRLSSQLQRRGVHRTLFPDQAVVSVVGVVGIAGSSAPAIANDAEVKLCMTQRGELGSERCSSNATATYRETRVRNDLDGRNWQWSISTSTSEEEGSLSY